MGASNRKTSDEPVTCKDSSNYREMSMVHKANHRVENVGCGTERVEAEKMVAICQEIGYGVD